MSLMKLAIQSFRYYLATNLVLALGVAAATAVLTGALIVGDSMRASLRKLALDRLGKIDEIVVSDGFFREELASEVAQSATFQSGYSLAEPVILFPNGSVQIGDEFSSDQTLRRVSGVNVFGIRPEFWRLANEDLAMPAIAGREVIVNRALAEQLGIASEFPTLTLRIPKPSQLPADSSLGKKRDLVESLVELQVAAIVPNESIGRFGLHVSQFDSPNIYLPIERLQESLQRSALKHKREPIANAILLSRNESAELDGPPVLSSLKPSLSDFGLAIKEVSQMRADADELVFDYYSLSSDRLVIGDEVAEAIKDAFPDATAVFTYLANDIRKQYERSGIPFSMVAGIDPGDSFPLVDIAGNRISELEPFDIVINEWAAENLNAKTGDPLTVTYFEPEAVGGEGVEREANFEVKAIAKLTTPDSPFQTRRRKLIPAQFLSESPTLANDPDLTPEVPGLTDAESIEKWDLPFATADKLRPEDDDYWNDYRTTPKAFVALGRSQDLWKSRFGKVTSFRIPKSNGKLDAVENKLLSVLHKSGESFGFSVLPIKNQALAASSGSTPFDALFLALSMFVIGAALILVSLLFRLTLQRRAAETGTLLAVGWSQAAVGRAWVVEMILVAAIGVVIGLAVGVAYAALMIFGLKTWWIGAISKPILELRLAPWVLGVGAASGMLICLTTIVFTVWGTRKVPVRSLLNGEMEAAGSSTERHRRSWVRWLIIGLLAGAVVLSIVASFLGGEPQAGAFMGAGFLVLTATLVLVYRLLTRPETESRARMSLIGLASLSAKRNPLRTTLTVGLVAVASFLIMAVSSFRLSPTDEGTAGFDLIATTDQPVFESLSDGSRFDFDSFSFRMKDGEDASCNNLYQSSQPRVLGVTEGFMEYFNANDESFRWAMTLNKVNNPWWLLNHEFNDGAIPVVIDKNTANYSLKIFNVGGDYDVQFESGESVKFRVVGFLENSILQGSLIIAEENFVRTFPQISGYRMFLARGPESADHEFADRLSSELEERFSDQGLDAESAIVLLRKFQQVQNTYISTFQTLGALGLLLGTFGLAIVQIRSVLERQQELGLMRSVGFRLSQLNRLILMENAWLLFVGLLVGIGSALITTLPHYLVGGASIPWVDLSILFLLITIFGLLSAWLASRSISKVPLIESLRG